MERFNDQNETERCAKCGAMGSAMEPHRVHFEPTHAEIPARFKAEHLLVWCRRCGYEIGEFAPRDSAPAESQ